MSNIPILNLPVAVSLSGTEYFPLVQGGTTKRAETALLASIWSGLAVGETVITLGTSGYVLYDNAGILGEYAVSGSGSVAMTTSPTFVTPILGVASATDLSFTGTSSAGLAVKTMTTAQRDSIASPSNGSVIYNSTTLTLNAYAGGAWGPIGGGSLTVGTTAISGGTTTRILYDNAGVLGEYAQVPLTVGGTNASLTASNGGIVYSDASAFAILSGTATAGQIIRSGASSAPSWSTSTYPATSSAGTILASGSTNTITATVTPTLGVAGTTLGTLSLTGNTSGTITIQPQAAAGTYNFNLPTGAGTSGQPLLSGGGGSTAMTFGTLGVEAGGTGAITLTSNGVLYGNGTSAVQITAQGGANTVLTANAGAPAFSSSPTIGTSVTTPLFLASSLGSVSAPVFSFSSDTDTGLWSPSANVLAASTAGSQRITIDSAGLVGIGTTTPIVGLHVEGATTVTARINLSSSVTGGSGSGGIMALYSYALPTAADQRLGVFLFGSANSGSGNGQNAAAVEGFSSEAWTAGSAQGAYFKFGTTPIGSATRTERMRIDAPGNVIINTAAISTSATDGFLYVPSCSGTPTGTPTTYTGRVPVVVDTTNNKLYFYSSSAWRDAGP